MVVQNSPKEYTWEPSARQWSALDIVFNNRAELLNILYGGAKGGGKSYWMCFTALALCIRIIELCEIKEVQKYPIPVGFLGRKTAKDFKNTTLNTWKKFIPQECYRIVGDPAKIIINERVQIDTGGLDSSDAVNQFNSSEYMFIGVDQAEETSIDDVAVLRGSLRGQINGKHIPYRGLWTANPGQCWLKDDFITTSKPDHYYVPALPTDNPHLPDGYTDTLTVAFNHRKELLDAYLHGSWDVFEDAHQVIRGEDLSAAEHRHLAHTDNRRYIACDPARFGDDETVMMLFDNDRIIGMKIFPMIKSDRLNNEIHVWACQENVDAVIIEENGLGGPICDWANNLANGQYEVINANVSADALNKTRFTNRRAEMWWNVGEMFARGDLSLHMEFMELADRQRLKSQLTAVRYDFAGQRLKLEDKGETKKRIRGSPDRGDCAVIGWSNWRNVKPKAERIKRRDRTRRKITALSA